LARLLEVPFLPLFVFDGPDRPDIKRGKRIAGSAHWLTNGMKKIIHAFGFEWRQVSSTIGCREPLLSLCVRKAPGEAEAELAYLNRLNLIDAILSDDVDTFLFGARVVVRK